MVARAKPKNAKEPEDDIMTRQMPDICENMMKFATVNGGIGERVKMSVGKETTPKGSTDFTWKMSLDLFGNRGRDKIRTMEGFAKIENGEIAVYDKKGKRIGNFANKTQFVFDSSYAKEEKPAAVVPAKTKEIVQYPPPISIKGTGSDIKIISAPSPAQEKTAFPADANALKIKIVPPPEVGVSKNTKKEEARFTFIMRKSEITGLGGYGIKQMITETNGVPDKIMQMLWNEPQLRNVLKNLKRPEIWRVDYKKGIIEFV